MDSPNPHSVDVLQQCQISPPLASVATTSLSLSYFDLLWLSHPKIERLFFYQVDYSKLHFMNTVLPNIKHSLSLTLQHFFPLAGSLTWPDDSPKPVILYIESESAVSLTVGESGYDLHHLSGNHERDENLFHPLLPDLPNKSVLALQITLFPNKGICFGITYHHFVGDGRILVQFVNSWASVCRSHGDTSFLVQSPLFYDRTTMVNDTKGIDMRIIDLLKITRETLDVPRDRGSPPLNKVRATFVLSPDKIKRIKEHVQKKTSQELRLSTFVITCAYVWVCSIRARKSETVEVDEDAMEYFLFAVDCRARLDPPLPVTYFGNCLQGGVTKGKGSDLSGENGVAIAAELIEMVIPTIKGGEGLLQDKETISSIDWRRCLSVAGSPKLGTYVPDFGWGIPNKAEVASIAAAGAISLSECPHEMGAVEIGLVRSRMQMHSFASLFANTQVFNDF